MKTSPADDFKALEALQRAADENFIPSRVTIGHNLYSYLEAVLRERIQKALESEKE